MANWTSALISGAGLWNQLDRFDDLGSYVEGELGGQAASAIEGSKFTPFTVSGFGGSATAGPGGIQSNQDPASLNQSNMLQGQANQFFNSASADQSGREQGIFDSIRAMQQPGEQRQMMGMESRAQGQGRLGISGANYGGGTPEMLAMQQAIAENRNNAAFESMNMARSQQMQDANIGSQFQNNSYLPQAQMMNMMNQGMQGAQMNQAGQLAGMNLSSQLRLGQVQSQVNSEKIRAELMGGLFNTIGGAFDSNTYDPLGDIGARFGGWLKDNIFG